MFKKYSLSGLIVVVCVLVFATPAHALDLRFKSFFDKFAPLAIKAQAQEGGEIIVAPEPVAPIAPVDQAQPLPPTNNDNTNNNPPSQPDNAPDGKMMPPAPPMMQSGGNNMQPGGGPNQQQFGPSDEQMAKQRAQQLKGMKQGLKPLKNSITSFEKMMAKGNTLSDALKAKIAQAKELAAKLEGATTADEISSDDMDNLRDLMNSLQEEQQSMQHLTEFRRNISQTERGVKNFESQLTRLQKQKIVVPADVTENLNKIKQLIAVVKTAQSWDEMQTAGVEDMGDLMDTLNDSRNNLDMLSRWPQTLKQMDKEITNLNRQIKKDKTIVDRLLKKDIDLTDNYNKFVEMAGKLKAARDDANAKITAGDSEGAFSAAQDDFFGQLDEVYQNAQVIEMMNGLGAFTSSFKGDLNKAKQTINKLKKKKIDTTELQAIYDDTKTKGDETLALIKIKPIDSDAVTAALEELGNLRVDFGNKVAELQGDDAGNMPWQQGPQQFKAVQMAPNFNQYFPPQQPQQQPAQNGGNGPTCNVNGVEMPGTCDQYSQK